MHELKITIDQFVGFFWPIMSFSSWSPDCVVPCKNSQLDSPARNIWFLQGGPQENVVYLSSRSWHWTKKKNYSSLGEMSGSFMVGQGWLLWLGKMTNLSKEKRESGVLFQVKNVENCSAPTCILFAVRNAVAVQGLEATWNSVMTTVEWRSQNWE